MPDWPIFTALGLEVVAGLRHLTLRGVISFANPDITWRYLSKSPARSAWNSASEPGLKAV